MRSETRILRARGRCGGAVATAAGSARSRVAAAPVPSPPVPEPESRTDNKAGGRPRPRSRAAAAAASGDGGSIRVSIEKIDELLNSVGELVITQSVLSQLAAPLEGRDAEELRSALGQLERHMRNLQESVMRVRMLPISVVFNRFPRLVRDLGQRLGKKIELRLTGESTELDKTVLEKIGDPLVHLVRNSIDHGIETPEVRIAAGKPAHGIIELHAYHKGGNVVVEVSDDGGGLKRDRILAKARERGLVGPDEELSEDRIFNLIFAPGFSTADVVSDVSGRGVGMDVVKRNINELGGHVQIHSTPGKGSMVRIRLPLTLAILDGQLARVGSEVYVVPIVSIVETIQVRQELVSSIADRAQVFRLRDDYLPIVRLYELFGIEPRAHRPARRPADDRRGRRPARRTVRRRADVAAAGGHQESRNQFPPGGGPRRRHHAGRRPRRADSRRPRRHFPFPVRVATARSVAARGLRRLFL